MSWLCAAAGAANIAPKKKDNDFRENSSIRSTLDPSAEGAVENTDLADAVLAGARVTAAGAANRTATILVGLHFFAIGHFHLLFCVAQAERIII
jgi:hypothetical protein